MEFLKDLGLKKTMPGVSTGTRWTTHKNGKKSTICSPIDGQVIAHVQQAEPEDYEHVIETAQRPSPSGDPCPPRSGAAFSGR